jgi:hypothetical protein
MRKLIVAVPLLALLGFSIWFAVEGSLLEGPDMPASIYIAMGLGIFFSIAVGGGLMALVFYSSRHGYDDPPRE